MDTRKKYTFEGWLGLGEGVHAELVDGELVMMDQPTILHQAISGNIFVQISNSLKDKSCKVFSGRTGVRLGADTVFVPDVMVVCDKSKLDNGKVCDGAPDMIVEVLSPTTARHDKVVKFTKYLKAGVREYWMVDPDTNTVQSYVLDNGRYVMNPYSDEDTAVPVHVAEGCTVNLQEVFHA